MDPFMRSHNANDYDKVFQQTSHDEPRNNGRFGTSGVWSGLGELVDLSASGALILKSRLKKIPKKNIFAIHIQYEELKVTANARVTRDFKKKGIGHLVAIEFIDLDVERREMLRDIIRNSRSWRRFDLSEEIVVR